MAIIIEEEKERGGAIVLIGYLVIIVTIVLAVYLLFFKNPGVVEKVVPGLKITTEVANLNNEIEKKKEIVESPSFIIRTENISIPFPGEGVAGKSNPFLP